MWSVPHLIEISLTSKGRRDIPSAAFDRGRPLAFDVGAPIVAVLQTVCDPASSPTPPVSYEGRTLRIGPELIARNQVITVSLLVDGPNPRLACQQAAIEQVSVVRRDVELVRRRRILLLTGFGASVIAGAAISASTYFAVQVHNPPLDQAESITITSL